MNNTNTDWLHWLFSTEGYKQRILLLKNGNDITSYIFRRLCMWLVIIPVIHLIMYTNNLPLGILGAVVVAFNTWELVPLLTHMKWFSEQQNMYIILGTFLSGVCMTQVAYGTGRAVSQSIVSGMLLCLSIQAHIESDDWDFY